LPYIGYDEDHELQNNDARLANGLPERSTLPKLINGKTYDTHGHENDANWINFEATVSTTSDQVAIAPGVLKKQWTKNNRSFFQYKTNHKISNFLGFSSGQYKSQTIRAGQTNIKAYFHPNHDKNIELMLNTAVLQKQWTKNNRSFFQYKVNHKISNFLGFSSGQYKSQTIRAGQTNIKAYFHPNHDKNIELMLNTAVESLKYFEQEYGPYPFPELSLVEIPNRAFARAYPATIYISEHVGLKESITQGHGKDDFSYLIAHEIAHQWWGHQLASAKVEGEVLLIETLADYSALMVMKKLYGETYVNSVVTDSTQKYLSGRGADVLGETPLYKMLGQRYLRYHKGPVVLNAIRHLISESTLNQALKLLLDKKSNATKNYATSLDLLHVIKEISDESHHEKIDEWLTEIVTYDLNISNAKTEQLTNGKYQVTATVSGLTFKHAPLVEKKFTHDVTVGIYSEVMGQPYLLQQQSVQMTNGVQQVTFILDDAPFKIIIDPNNLFIDRNRINNESKFIY